MIKITLDPGHGRYDNRSPNNPLYVEGTQMWHLAVYLEKALARYGIEVVITRPNINENPTLEERGEIAGESESDLLLSLHSNAPKKSEDGTFDASVTGTVAFYPLGAPGIKSLADTLGKKVSELMGHYHRGSFAQSYPNSPNLDYYAVIRNAVAYGCRNAIILEHGFHTNLSDSNFLLNDENLKALAEAEAKIVAEYFGISEAKNVPEEWAREAVEWATDNGILKGDEHGDLKLKDPCTREEVVTMLYRALGKEKA